MSDDARKIHSIRAIDANHNERKGEASDGENTVIEEKYEELEDMHRWKQEKQQSHRQLHRKQEQTRSSSDMKQTAAKEHGAPAKP